MFNKPKKYVHKFKQAVLTEYGNWDGASGKIGCLGTELIENYHVASHNIPCGTRVYIPDLKGVINNDGIFEVADTGGHGFDFDIYISKDKQGSVGKRNSDVYVLEWGDKKITCSYTHIIEYYMRLDIMDEKGRMAKYHDAWIMYLEMGGKLINFHKFNDEDKKIRQTQWYGLI